jgi:hypothetical protein
MHHCSCLCLSMLPDPLQVAHLPIACNKDALFVAWNILRNEITKMQPNNTKPLSRQDLRLVCMQPMWCLTNNLIPQGSLRWIEVLFKGIVVLNDIIAIKIE